MPSLRRPAAVVALTIGLLTSACGGSSPEVSALTADQFQDKSGCGNTYLYAVAQQGQSEAVLSVDWSQLLDAGAGEHTATVDDAQVTVRLQFGQFISNLACNDVVEREPIVTSEGTATAGTLVATVRPHEDPNAGDTGFVDLTASDLVFRDENGNEVTVTGDLRFDNVFVGWLAG